MLKNVNVKMRARDLKGIINLPNYPDDQIIDVSISSDEERKIRTPEEREKAHARIREIMDEALKSPDFDPNKTLDDYRWERLEAKYGPFN